MGMHVHPVNLVKVEVDGMEVDKIAQVLTEVVATLRRTEHLGHCQVMSVLFAQDLDTWAKRKKLYAVRKVLVELREFNPASKDDPEAFDVVPYAVNTLRDLGTGDYLFTDKSRVSLQSLVAAGVLPEGTTSTFIHVNELFEHRKYFPNIAQCDEDQSKRHQGDGGRHGRFRRERDHDRYVDPDESVQYLPHRHVGAR